MDNGIMWQHITTKNSKVRSAVHRRRPNKYWLLHIPEDYWAGQACWSVDCRSESGSPSAHLNTSQDTCTSDVLYSFNIPTFFQVKWQSSRMKSQWCFVKGLGSRLVNCLEPQRLQDSDRLKTRGCLIIMKDRQRVPIHGAKTWKIRAVKRLIF